MIAVPYHLGRRDVEVGRGPTVICKVGQAVLPASRPSGRLVFVDYEESRQESRLAGKTAGPTSELDGIAAVNTQLARAVSAHPGPPIILAGLSRDDLGIVWFDAHGDFNTPETSISGSIEGMSLAIATGSCHGELRERIGLARPVPEANVLLVATRNLDPKESVRLERSAVSLIGLETLPAALEALASRARAVYLHLDIDVLDPSISPGVNFSTPGGIAPEQLYQAIRTVAAVIPIAAATIANFNPDRDREDRTLRIAEKLVAILGEVSLS